MRKNILFLIILFFTFYTNAQVNQVKLITGPSNSLLRQVKFDASDGSSVHVGYINNSVSGTTGNPISNTGNDCYIVKMDGNQQIIWEKSFPNTGDDYFTQVIICSNGDYIAVGQIIQNNISRGFACRFNKTNGNLIWSEISNNSINGEIFYDVKETHNGNIVIVGMSGYPPNTGYAFVVDLNSSGTTLWSQISSSPNSAAFAVTQLLNDDLLIGCSLNTGSNFYAELFHMKELNGAVISQNYYNLNTTIPNSGLTLNSIWPLNFNLNKGIVNMYFRAFYGQQSAYTMCIYTYDLNSKNLIGNLYYHTGDTNPITDFAFSALTSNDFIISQSFTNPNKIYVSRVTNGKVIYDRLINSSVTSIYASDTTSSNMIFCGTENSNTVSHAYILAGTRDFPEVNSNCSISNSNTLALQSSVLTPVNTFFNFSPTSPLIAISINPIIPVVSIQNVCGTTLPLILENFSGKYDELTKTNKLSWKTATELNSKYFSIERSNDNGMTFISIGQIEANGTSNAVSIYEFSDNHPFMGANIYRLKEHDKDEKINYSSIISIMTQDFKKDFFYLSPNPASSFTVINSHSTISELTSIKIYDQSGRLIKQDAIVLDNTHPYKLSLNKIPGLYYIKVDTGIKHQNLKLIIQ